MNILNCMLFLFDLTDFPIAKKRYVVIDITADEHMYCLTFYIILTFLPPATKWQQGNVFTPVCHSVHRGALCQGETDTPYTETPGQRPPGERPPDRDSLHRDPPRQRPSKQRPPPYSNQLVVRILLECILILKIYSPFTFYKYFRVKLFCHRYICSDRSGVSNFQKKKLLN